ncbi:hypothetical protein SAMD00019534_105540 [Acytostelium subglobosum LB1]|uniref:hypothetical protein n=1 Tax=Acytostelium subglobosum LB1 TaxID=1410327 RepID=UPI000644D5F5|nr:hypothetical protein SAMD00019534_105540 [Acytostelium subglobosum LB1]GAM27379.1 hypothetical protein SAMD00019534_105540 [Acytostelium subglobosum LB1]|eukprot:XP_012749846.1 hypothetical protein SAMD00019534_105540 [Acytostelium subglobosum LB1]
MDNSYRLTPHKITLCSVIDHYVNGQLNPIQKKSLSLLLVKHIKNPSNFKEPLLGTFIDTELRQVAKLSKSYLDDDLIQCITFETIDDLNEFFSSLALLFEESRQDEEDEDDSMQTGGAHINVKSILGIYVKKVLMVFNNLMFDGLIHLYEQINEYMKQYHDTLSSSTSTSTATSGLGSNITFLSPFDQERFAIQEMVRVNNSIGKVNPMSLQKEIDQLKSILPDVNKTRYINLLTNIEHMEYEQSIEELHRYFDYCNSDTSQSNITFLPYAVLNLSKVHFHFGHYEQAYLSLQEAIRIAQERNDHASLALALHQLSKFQHKSVLQSFDDHHLFTPLRSHTQQDILDKGIKRAEELELSSLSSLNYLSRAKLNLTSMSTAAADPSTSGQPEAITRTSSSTTAIPPSKLWHDIFQPIEKSQLLNKDSIAGVQLKAAAWDMLGNGDLSTYFSELSLHLNGAASTSNTTTSRISLDSSSSKDSIQSYCQMAVLESKRGNYNKSKAIFQHCIQQFPYYNHIKTSLPFTIKSVMFDHSLAINDLEQCELLIESLLALLNPLSPDDSECSGWPQILTTYERIGQLYLAKQEFDICHQFLNGAIELAKAYGCTANLTQFHILLATLYQRCKGGDLAHQAGLNHMLCALSLAEQHNLPRHLAEANLLLANSHLHTKSFEKARSLLDSTKPLVLQDCILHAQLNLLYAKCIVGVATPSLSKQERTSKLQEALYYMTKAMDGAKQIGHVQLLKDIYLDMSVTNNDIGNIDQRNHYAKLFRQLVTGGSAGVVNKA